MSSRWLNGPSFLTELQSSWPKFKAIPSLQDNDPDVKSQRGINVYTAKKEKLNPLDELRCVC